MDKPTATPGPLRRAKAPAPPAASAEPRTTISLALVNATIGYLATRPYREVAQLIEQIQQDARPIAAAPEG